MTRVESTLAVLLSPFGLVGCVLFYDTAVTKRPDIASLIGQPAQDAALGCCGPQGMIDAFEQATRTWAIERIHVERFIAPPIPVDPDAKPYSLVLARSKARLKLPPGHTMMSPLQGFG